MSKYRGLGVLSYILILVSVVTYRNSVIHQGEIAEQERAERCAKPVLEHFRKSATCLGYVPENLDTAYPRQ